MNRSDPKRIAASGATSLVTQGMVTCRNRGPQESIQQGMTIGDTEGLLNIAPRQGMMQNKSSWFRVGAIADLLAASNLEWVGLSFRETRLGRAKPIFHRAP